MKIFLIGFMGSGKTSVGKKLAKSLDSDFIDLDRLVEIQTGRSINDIFSEEGEEAFRILEHNALQNLDTEKDMIIATGGGTPCHYNNMEFMKATGTTIYLRLQQEALLKRLLNVNKKRPLIKDLSDTELHHFIEKTMLERSPHYEQAQYIVESLHITNAAAEIQELIQAT